jgi:hypothetical protein
MTGDRVVVWLWTVVWWAWLGFLVLVLVVRGLL